MSVNEDLYIYIYIERERDLYETNMKSNKTIKIHKKMNTHWESMQISSNAHKCIHINEHL